MGVSRDEVLRIAELARLRLTDREVDRLTAELNGILDHMAVLGELDLAGAPAMGLAAEWAAPMRDDEPGADLLAVPVVELAPAMVDGFFTVPRLPALDDDAAGEAEGANGRGEESPT